MRLETLEALEEQEAADPALLLFFLGRSSHSDSELARDAAFDLASALARAKDHCAAVDGSTSTPTAESVSPHMPRGSTDGLPAGCGVMPSTTGLRDMSRGQSWLTICEMSLWSASPTVV